MSSIISIDVELLLQWIIWYDPSDNLDSYNPQSIQRLHPTLIELLRTHELRGSLYYLDEGATFIHLYYPYFKWINQLKEWKRVDKILNEINSPEAVYKRAKEKYERSLIVLEQKRRELKQITEKYETHK